MRTGRPIWWKSSDFFAVLLSVSSIAGIFLVAFPWQHHNESLLWDIALTKSSIWDTVTSNPIPMAVANYRPLGLMLAWTTYHLTSGAVWLQQIVNLFVTMLAWVIACVAAKQRYNFAWLSFFCNAVFFSGYIYLFHLHGVFYPPLLVLIAVFLLREGRDKDLGWRNVFSLLLFASLIGMFHPFAFLISSAFLVGLSIENRVRGFGVRYTAVMLGVAVMLALAGLFAFTSNAAVHQISNSVGGFPLQSLIVSYQTLESNRLATFAAIVLACLGGATFGRARKQRIIGAAVAGGCAVVLTLFGIPGVVAWIAVCFASSLRQRRIATAALILVCALLPLATGTGSPTYAVPVLMPCISVMAGALPSPRSLLTQRRLPGVVAATVFALVLIVRLGFDPWPINKVTLPLLAEKEKTEQLMQIMNYLDHRKELTGHLKLCNEAGPPAKGVNAIDRRQRPPIDSYSFDLYVKSKYGERLSSGADLYLCFGNQHLPRTSVVYSVPGRWAGDASMQAAPRDAHP